MLSRLIAPILIIVAFAISFFFNVNRTTSLYSEVREGDVAAVEKLLTRGANPNERGKGAWSPFHLAVYTGQELFVKEMIAKNADVNSRGADGTTPLHLAAQEGHVEITRLLIGENADINATRNDGSTPLHLAALSGHVGVVETLVEARANVGIANRDGNYAAHMAVLGSTPAPRRQQAAGEILSQIEGAGGSMNVGNNMGETPLMIAARTNRGMVVGALLDLRASMAETSNSGYSAMGLALRDGALGAAEILLTAGAPTIAPEGDMVNPRIDAAFRGDLARLQQLGRMEMANFAGQTPLHAATFSGQQDAVNEILNLVENASAIPQTYESYIVRQTRDGKTAFFIAVERNNQQLAEVLADRYADATLKTIAWAKELNDAPEDTEEVSPADAVASAKQVLVNTGDASGMTPIFIPLMGGNIEFAEYLAGLGADLEARMAEGFAPIHSVTAANQVASIEWLLANGSSIESRTTNGRMPLHIAAESGTIDAMRLLLARGAKVTEVTMDRVTPLHYAAESGSVEAVEILLANGADIASETVDGRQPLHFAAISGQVETSQFLIARGASVNARMLNGQTPLHLSANAMQPGTTDLLLASDAETTLMDSDGRTPLYMAEAAMSVPYNSSGQAQRAINTFQALLGADPDLMVQRR